VVDVDGTISTGSAGERIAAEYLRLAGNVILESNYRSGHLEVDLVAMDGDCLLFVEVKTRRSSSFGDALEAVGRGKIFNMRKAAREYLSSGKAPRGCGEIRFDLIAIDLSLPEGTMVLRHLKGIS